MPRMAMGKPSERQPPLWIATADLPSSPAHPFYTRLNAVLDAEFDTFVEDRAAILCADHGTSGAGAGPVFPAAADRVL